MAGNLTAMIASIFSGGVTPDPYYPYTTLLLPGNGTNGAQNNTFLDGSTNNFTITRNGNTTQGTFSPFSQTGWGNYFDGSSQYLSLANNAVFDFNADPFTIETWFYITGNAAQNNDLVRVASLFCAFPTSGSTANVYNLYLDGNGTTTGTGIGFSKTVSGSNINVSYAATIAQNTWHHVAVVRSSSTTLTLYLNGQQVAQSTSYSGNVNTGGNPISVAQLGYVGYLNRFPGYVSNLRITKGRAVYTGAFTPPTAPLTRTTGGTNPPQGTECSLLTCQSNRFLDSNGVNTPASSPLTITPNGSPTVVAFSPFNPTASWSAATYGGSGYFDGSGDYLTAPNNAAFAALPGDFTLELWVYLTAQTTGNALFGPWAGNAGSAANSSWLFTQGTTSASNLRFVYSNGSSVVIYEGSGGLGTNQWFHLVAVRSGTNFALFSNGNRVYSNASVSASIPQNTSNLGVMAGADGFFASTGYVSSARVVKGTAVYDPTLTTCTVPTAPLTAITNTSLLLNFTNAGIYDATSKNDLETVGNAQISTAISAKWGSGTMAFDGNGDGLYRPNTDLFNFGTGNFTIEFWLYYSSKTGYQTIASLGYSPATSTGWLIQTGNGDGKVIFYVQTSGTIIASDTGSTVNTGQWYHIAIVRNSGTTTIYRDGTSVGSGSDSTNYSTTGVFYIGGGTNTGFNGGYFNGYIQDFRITKGYARYTANFTAPTAAFPTL